jgi:hypothetical protein
MSPIGTFETSHDVRSSVAFGGIADMARTPHFGSVETLGCTRYPYHLDRFKTLQMCYFSIWSASLS